jgi:hypothetical protein
MSGAVAAPSNVPVTKTDTLASAAAPDPNAATNLTVELVGYGAGDGQQNVTQACQDTPFAEADEECRKKKRAQ